jgi:hypothetical protein
LFDHVTCTGISSVSICLSSVDSYISLRVCSVTEPDTCCLIVCSVQVKELQNPDDVFDTILGLIVRLAEHGLIHCDFNEFNIMVFHPFPLPVCVDL